MRPFFQHFQEFDRAARFSNRGRRSRALFAARLLAASLFVWATAALLPAQGAAPAAATQAVDPLEAKAREILRLLDQKRFDEVAPQFNADALKALPPDKLGQVWDHMQTIYGPLKSQGEASADTAGKLRAVKIACQFERGALDAKFVFDDQSLVAGIFFLPPSAAPSVKPPDAIDEIPATVGPESLPGTISLPHGAGPWPAALLVQDSGPLDRDESIDAEKPFRDLAWGLAERGAVVLRYDKRTFALRAQKAALRDTLTADSEATDDAVAGLEVLRKLKNVDPERIYLVGHGFGGMLAPRIAKRAKEAGQSVAGLALLAPEARMPHLLLIEKAQYILGLDGKIDEHDKGEIDHLKMQADAVDALLKSGKSGGSQLLLGAPANYWLSLRDYDAPAVAAALGSPVLLLHAKRDFQIPEADFKLWSAALGGKPGVSIKEYPALNHLLIAGEGTPSPAEYQKPGLVDAQAIADLAAWIKDRTPPAK